jgi:hypothetical protein
MTLQKKIALEQGRKAYRDGLHTAANPYDARFQPTLARAWVTGWMLGDMRKRHRHR